MIINIDVILGINSNLMHMDTDGILFTIGLVLE